MPDIFFDIFGRDHNVKQTFDEIGSKASGLGGIMKGVAAGAAEMGIVKMGEATVNTYKDVAGSSLLLQREMGGTIEDASRLNFVLSQSGLTAEDTKKSFGIFSKTLVAAQEDQKKAAALNDELGFSFQDVNGKMLPMPEILAKVSDHFHEMENGPDKTALAGQDMVPLLNKGGDAMREMAAKSDELGVTLSQDQAQGFIDAKKEGREWDATMRGLQVTVGSALLPVLSGMEKFLHDNLVPAIQGLEHWFKSLDPNMQRVVTTLFGVIAVGAPLLLIVGKFAGVSDTAVNASTYQTLANAAGSMAGEGPGCVVHLSAPSSESGDCERRATLTIPGAMKGNGK